MGKALSTLQPNSDYIPTKLQLSLQPRLQRTPKNLQIRHGKKSLKNMAQLADALQPCGNPQENSDLLHILEKSLSKAILMRSSKLGPVTYQQILDYINNTQEPSHNFGIKADQIFFVTQNSEPDFSHFCKTDLTAMGKPRMLLWHGTHIDRVSLILQNGLKLPGYNRNNMQGQGLYFADRASKSAQYCHPQRLPKSGDKGCLLLCEVFLGNTLYATEPRNNRNQLSKNYHSVGCEGRWKPAASQTIVVETDAGQGNLLLPFGISELNKDMQSYELMYNEYIVYNTDQVKIKYLIFFTFTDAKYENVIMK